MYGLDSSNGWKMSSCVFMTITPVHRHRGLDIHYVPVVQCFGRFKAPIMYHDICTMTPFLDYILKMKMLIVIGLLYLHVYLNVNGMCVLS